MRGYKVSASAIRERERPDGVAWSISVVCVACGVSTQHELPGQVAINRTNRDRNSCVVGIVSAVSADIRITKLLGASPERATSCKTPNRANPPRARPAEPQNSAASGPPSCNSVGDGCCPLGQRRWVAPVDWAPAINLYIRTIRGNRKRPIAVDGQVEVVAVDASKTRRAVLRRRLSDLPLRNARLRIVCRVHRTRVWNIQNGRYHRPLAVRIAQLDGGWRWVELAAVKDADFAYARLRQV